MPRLPWIHYYYKHLEIHSAYQVYVELLMCDHYSNQNGKSRFILWVRLEIKVWIRTRSSNLQNVNAYRDLTPFGHPGLQRATNKVSFLVNRANIEIHQIGNKRKYFTIVILQYRAPQYRASQVELINNIFFLGIKMFS